MAGCRSGESEHTHWFYRRSHKQSGSENASKEDILFHTFAPGRPESCNANRSPQKLLGGLAVLALERRLAEGVACCHPIEADKLRAQTTASPPIHPCGALSSNLVEFGLMQASIDKCRKSSRANHHVHPDHRSVAGHRPGGEWRRSSARQNSRPDSEMHPN